MKKVLHQYFFSVEGETEKWYLEWLAQTIRTSPQAQAWVKFDIKVNKDPVSRIKQIALAPKEIFHVFDIESQEKVHVDQLATTLERLKKASSLKSTRYRIGYSNFAFELWIVLHKSNGMTSLAHRRQYLKTINKVFGEKFEDLHEYKHENNFKRVLQKLSLSDVKEALKRAEILMQQARQHYQPVKQCGYEYFRENPSLSLHEVIGKILKECGL